MSPKSSEQLEAIRERSRNKILLAALELFASQGYHNTSVNQIAKRAEIAKGLVYNYFSSKEALLEGIVLHGMRESQDIFDQVEQQPTAEGKIEVLIDSAFTYIIEKYDYYKLLTALSLKLEQFPQLREIVQQKFEGMTPYLTQLLEELGVEHPRKEAIKLGALLDGMGLQYMVLKEAFPLEEMRLYLKQLYSKYDHS